MTMTPTRSRFAFIIFLAGLMITGCSDNASDAGKASTVKAAQSQSKDYGDGCSWLTAEQIESVMGAAPDKSGPPLGLDYPGCHWKFQDGYQLLVQVMLSPPSIGSYDSFDEYVKGMTEYYGEDSTEGQKEITGLGALAVFDSSVNVLVVAMGERDLSVTTPKSVGGEEQLIAIAKLVLEKLG